MTITLYQRLLALPYLFTVTVLILCIGLTLGLWERGSKILADIKGLAGDNVFLIQIRQDFVGGTGGLPTSPETLQKLKAVGQADAIAYKTGTSRPTSGFAIVSTAISNNYFAFRKFGLSRGVFSKANNEVVIGSKLAQLLEQREKVPILNSLVVLKNKQYQVVGVLESTALRGDLDSFDDWTAFIPIEGFTGFDLVSQMYLRTTSKNLVVVRQRLEQWLKQQGLGAYQVRLLSDTYRSDDRSRSALLLGQGLVFATLAILLLGTYATISFQITQSLERASVLGVYRAFGATRQKIEIGELIRSLRWLIVPLAIGLPSIYFVNLLFTQLFGLDARPSWQVIVSSLLLIVVLSLFSSWLPIRWLGNLPVTSLIRGQVRTPLQNGLPWIGLGLGVIALVVQNASNQTAIDQTQAIIGKIGQRVATLATTLTAEGFADPRSTVRLTEDDGLALKKLELFSRVGFIENYYSYVKNQFVDTRAYQGDYLWLIGVEMLLGRTPQANTNEAIIGADLAKRLQKDKSSLLGQQLLIFNEQFRVVGIYKTATQSILGGARSDQILIQKTLSTRSLGTAFLVQVKPNLAIIQSLQTAADLLSSRHQDPDNQPIRVFRPDDFAPSLLLALNQLSKLYSFIAILMLVMAGVSLFSWQWLWVIQHTSEIGIKRAFGATRKTIRQTLLYSSGQRALQAGLIGVLIGVLSVWLLAAFQQRPFLIDWFLLGFAPLIAVSVALCASWLPVEIATRIEPAIAIRLKN